MHVISVCPVPLSLALPFSTCLCHHVGNFWLHYRATSALGVFVLVCVFVFGWRSHSTSQPYRNPFIVCSERLVFWHRRFHRRSVVQGAFSMAVMVALQGCTVARLAWRRTSRSQDASAFTLARVSARTSRQSAVLVYAESKNQPGPDSDSVPTSNAKVPAWAQPGSSEDPPWAKKESLETQKPAELPFWLLLLFSTFVAIAAVGLAIVHLLVA